MLTGKPATARRAGFLGHLRVDRMPDEGRQQRAGSVFFGCPHSGKNLQAGHLTCVQLVIGTVERGPANLGSLIRFRPAEMTPGMRMAP